MTDEQFDYNPDFFNPKRKPYDVENSMSPEDVEGILRRTHHARKRLAAQVRLGVTFSGIGANDCTGDPDLDLGLAILLDCQGASSRPPEEG